MCEHFGYILTIWHIGHELRRWSTIIYLQSLTSEPRPWNQSLAGIFNSVGAAIDQTFSPLGQAEPMCGNLCHNFATAVNWFSSDLIYPLEGFQNCNLQTWENHAAKLTSHHDSWLEPRIVTSSVISARYHIIWWTKVKCRTCPIPSLERTKRETMMISGSF